jgi:hypothetical protein
MMLQCERHRRAAEAIIESLLEPRLDVITTALRRAAMRGETRPGAVTSLPAQAGPGLVVHQQLHYVSRPSQAEVAEIVDRLLLLPAAGLPRQPRWG